MRFAFVLIFCGAVAITACKSSSKVATSSEITQASQTDEVSERDGTSYEKAIIAKSIPDEYNWLKKNHPGSQFIQQSLRHYKNVPYDVLTVKLPDGTKKDFYFDISSFFGKF
ncbi:MAG TPA: hypothetical protein PK325_07700 [Cyclobacteriaceae bacterium]|nr:hypothetical protein [Cyclobacteriaceae bacterium]HMV07248.1 hypothetical protein [Cyclobacteriaceae bacterium]HMV88563.1 hypothetical protein [Cyclobacteriaceae bacterium]HMW99397.1 hypothetical protein [Cyclobacteriaceae bacterium]HMX48814.1 hypothetical protein [Cyclobacteriaceae bacterium]